jgi:hypothetical protein
MPSRSSQTGPFSRDRKAEPSFSELAGKAKGKGPLRIIISLDKQQLTLYAGDEVIAHSRVSSGQRGHSTPTGVFSIIQKDRWHRSNIYDDAPMYFMQRLTWSGVALHQGIVPNYPASHGCIRMPEAFARQLWTTTKLGARVIVSHANIAPVAIAHAKLFVPKAAVASKPPLDSLKAAEQAWKLAQLDKRNPVTWVSVTDVPTPSLPTLDEQPESNLRPLKPGVHQPQGRQAVRAQRLRAGVRPACSHRTPGSAAWHPRVHCHGCEGGQCALVGHLYDPNEQCRCGPRPHHDPAGGDRADFGADDGRRLAYHLRPRSRVGDRHRHRFRCRQSVMNLFTSNVAQTSS